VSRRRTSRNKEALEDARIMRKALVEARRGYRAAWPNPLVGAVVMQGKRMLARGYHRRPGEPHAEIMALRRAGRRARGGTLYVTLEPCAHHGRTPPCVEAIIQAGIARVVFAQHDPNPRVAGRGAVRLREAGIEVAAGVLGRAARRLNEVFLHTITSGRPFVLLKSATTLDGAVATASGQSQWITGEASRRAVHRMRRDTAAVLVGRGTVETDDPALTVRHVQGQSPLRIILDSRLRTPLDARVCTDLARGTVFAAIEGADAETALLLEARGARVWFLPANREGRVDLLGLLDRAAQERIASILVEGGAQVFTAFLQAGLADKLCAFIAPKIVGGGQSLVLDMGIEQMDCAHRLHDVVVRQVGEDALVEGYIDPYFDTDPADASARLRASREA
jgi:diaminohydroxyphosphoribosylaminopyrimidine deaminase/5-amino-6-(5-phosphoribosylamino)uracil reductase